MGVWSKFNTLLRAGARESVERVTDANAVRIYRQEIVEAEEMLQRRRDALAAMIASRRELERDMENARARIAKREQQLRAVSAGERGEALLQHAAGDIAAAESRLETAAARHAALCSRVGDEELRLRKLLAETREHRRDLRLLEAQLARGRNPLHARCGETISARLALLRDSRRALRGGVCDGDDLEMAVDEALQRVDRDPVDACLAEAGQDAGSRRTAAVLERLRALE